MDFDITRCTRKSKNNPNAYTVPELKEIAKKMSIKGISSMNKDKLCAAIQEKDKKVKGKSPKPTTVKKEPSKPHKKVIKPNFYNIVASRICTTLEYEESLTFQNLRDDAVFSGAYNSSLFEKEIDDDKLIKKVIANGLIEEIPEDKEYKLTTKGKKYLNDIKHLDSMLEYGVDMDYRKVQESFHL